MIKNTTQYNRGYTLLFAVLVSALVLSVGISILNISKKEFLLASSARESITAFYAADSGLECAKYYDDKGSFDEAPPTPLVDIECALTSAAVVTPITSTSLRSYKFQIQINSSACAIITVEKATVNGILVTNIESRGYNIGWNTTINPPSCSSPSPRRVERALYYTYQ